MKLTLLASGANFKPDDVQSDNSLLPPPESLFEAMGSADMPDLNFSSFART